jgi:hypothetical protein
MSLFFALTGFVLASCSVEPVPPVAPSVEPSAAPLGESVSMSDSQVRERRHEVHDALVAFRDDLEAQDSYDCCTKEPCTWCALHSGGCACGEGLRRGEPVCEQCAYLWRRGQGDEPGVDPESVMSFLEAERAVNASREPAAPQGKPVEACVCAHDKKGVVQP